MNGTIFRKRLEEECYQDFYCHDGNCECLQECSRGRKLSENAFCCSHAASVGEYYGDGSIPRVLTIGKEGVEHKKIVGSPALSSTRNAHYRGTLATLLMLLRPGDNKYFGGKEYDGHTLCYTDNLCKEYDYLLKRFALTNHYHCAFKINQSPRNVPTTDLMWYNCQRIIKREIEILQPDIIIIQASWFARVKSAVNINDIKGYVHEDNKVKEIIHKVFEVTEPGGRKFYVSGSYHPASGHFWYNDIDNFKVRINEIYKRMK